jgi:bacillithiol system protein YtxJ
MPLSRFPPHVVTPLSTLADLDTALARSALSPILIFKHSTTCGLSTMAAEEVADLLRGAPIDADVYVVDVHGGRAISRAITERLKIPHESPQALLIANGAVRWHRSHAGVTAGAIARALAHLRPARQ